MGGGPSNLSEAIKSNDASTVKRLLRKKKKLIDVNGTHDGQTPLFKSVTSNSLDVVQVLFEHGADPGALCMVKNKEGFEFEWTALHESCRKGNLPMTKALIQAGCDVNSVAHHQMTPVHVAAWHGHKDIVIELVKAGCDINRLDMFQESALVIPICYGDTPVVEALINSGCKLTSRSWGNTRKVRGKYEEDFRKTLYGRHGPYSLFLLAIKYSWLHIAGLLLQHGCNPNKYQLHDILKNIKSNLGRLDTEGCHLVRCLLACGYRLTERDGRRLQALTEQDDYEYYDDDLVRWLQAQVGQPLPLAQLCRAAIRACLRVAGGHTSILGRVEKLAQQLPRSLLDYLSVRELDYSCHHGGSSAGQGTSGSSAAATTAAAGWSETVQESADRDPLYFAMPRRRPRYDGHIYKHFWRASCCLCK